MSLASAAIAVAAIASNVRHEPDSSRVPGSNPPRTSSGVEAENRSAEAGHRSGVGFGS